MTNPDTSTLNGALEQLGITMADNLVTMGVSDADPSDGLTTLAGKILEIAPVPPTPTPASIDLTGTKSILSYADSESCVLTATVLDSSDNPVEGVTVNLYNGSTLWDTLTTDSSGECSKTYSSAGSGDITFTAEVDGTLLTKTYAIQDCQYWNDGSSVGTLQIDSGVTCTSNGSYITITKSTSGEKYVKLPVNLPSSFEFSFELAENGTGNPYAWIIDSNYYGAAGGTTSQFAKLNDNGPTINTPAVKDGVVTMTYQNGTLTVKYDNTQLNSKSASVTGKPIGFYTNSGRYQYLKNIKLKQL